MSESKNRLYEALYLDLGDTIIGYLKDADVHEILLNPDQTLWIDSVSRGKICVGDMQPAQAFAIMNMLAGIHQFVVSDKNPILEAQLPCYREMQGERFTGQIPPIVSNPSFSIRKRAQVVFELADYVESGRMTSEQAQQLRILVQTRQNVLVAGGPGSGKTTLTNTLIHEAVQSEKDQRFITLEDLPELKCTAKNQVSMLTSTEVSMTRLLKTAMRMLPDRILIGEVRGAEALDMLKAWNTGCPGGICTVHANGAEEAIQRILDLAMEAGLKTPPVSLVQHTIDAVVSVMRQGSQKGVVKEIVTTQEMDRLKNKPSSLFTENMGWEMH